MALQNQRKLLKKKPIINEKMHCYIEMKRVTTTIVDIEYILYILYLTKGSANLMWHDMERHLHLFSDSKIETCAFCGWYKYLYSVFCAPFSSRKRSKNKSANHDKMEFIFYFLYAFFLKNLLSLTFPTFTAKVISAFFSETYYELSIPSFF